ncbi:MAG: LysR family transcriptional regulator [Paracoccaceae bacterium]
MIKIEMLRCFSAVAQSGNLADAAARLGRTQSAVSMTLKQLEEDLGQKLFEGERKSKLTPLGEQIFTLAQQQVQAFDNGVREIRASAQSPKGLLRVVSIPSATGNFVPHAAKEMTARHPGLKIDVRDADTEVVIDTLVRGQADVGIASGEPSLNGVQSDLLFQDDFGLTCASDHPLAKHEGSLAFADAEAFAFVGNNLCHQIKHARLQNALANTRLHAHNTLSLIGILQTGNWFTILPGAVVQQLPCTLVFRPLSDLNAKRTVSVLVSERSSQRSFAEEFISVLQMLCPTNSSRHATSN